MLSTRLDASVRPLCPMCVCVCVRGRLRCDCVNVGPCDVSAAVLFPPEEPAVPVPTHTVVRPTKPEHKVPVCVCACSLLLLVGV